MSGRCEACEVSGDLAHASPAYRRALVIVIALNLGMGVTEMAGGLLGASQALKADAIDFLGDGSITLLGLLALARGPRWRARAALAQGVFLAVLGVGVIGAVVYRALVPEQPEAGLMSGMGALALATNVAAALVLVRHRHGDASVRAVWLFSCNDALGNVAVIAAGGLVLWTGTVWPDLLAAVGIAGLFLGSAVSILRDARAELRALGGAAQYPRVAAESTR